MARELLPLQLTDLPNEILIHILDYLSTQELASLTPLSHRFSAIAVHLLEQRLIDAAQLHARALLLEAFHPSAKLLETCLDCTYLGTPGLDDHLPSPPARDPFSLAAGSFGHSRMGSDVSTRSVVSEGSVDESCTPPWERLRELWNLRSHFRPHRRSASPKLAQRHPAGDIPGSRTYQPPTNQAAASNTEATQTGGSEASQAVTELMQQAGRPNSAVSNAAQAAQRQSDSLDAWAQLGMFPRRNDHTPLISQRVYLDAGENFSQLQAVTTLVRPGPRRGLYEEVVTVSDGVIRLFRDWLGARAGRREMPAELETSKPEAVSSRKGKAKAMAESEAERRARRQQEQRRRDEYRVLWVNDGDNVGLKLRVHERRWNRRTQERDTAIFRAVDEDLPVCYEVEYEEVVVKTRHLLVVSERSQRESQERGGKALVMGTILR